MDHSWQDMHQTGKPPVCHDQLLIMFIIIKIKPKFILGLIKPKKFLRRLLLVKFLLKVFFHIKPDCMYCGASVDNIIKSYHAKSAWCPCCWQLENVYFPPIVPTNYHNTCLLFQIMPDHYHVRHHKVSKRSIHPHREHHDNLASHPEVSVVFHVHSLLGVLSGCTTNMAINSLTRRGYGCDFKTHFTDWCITIMLHPKVNITQCNWWFINIGAGNGLVPDGTKPLLAPMLTQVPWLHMALMGHKYPQWVDSLASGKYDSDFIITVSIYYKFYFYYQEFFHRKCIEIDVITNGAKKLLPNSICYPQLEANE